MLGLLKLKMSDFCTGFCFYTFCYSENVGTRKKMQKHFSRILIKNQKSLKTVKNPLNKNSHLHKMVEPKHSQNMKHKR